MMMSMKQIWIVVAAGMLVACSGPGAERPNACGEGDRLDLSSQSVCVYTSELLVETGFQCPASHPHGMTYGELAVCAEQDQLPSDFFDEAEQRYPDQAPSGECERVVCGSLTQQCVAGTCDPEDDLEEPVLVATPATLEFGTVLVNDRQAKQLEITNESNVLAQIDAMEFDDASGTFTIADTSPFGLAAGDTRTLTLYCEPRSPDSFNASLSVRPTTGETLSVSVSCDGVSAPSCALAPDPYEPNADERSAAQLTSDTQSDEATLCPGEEDWFYLDAVVGDVFEVSVVATDALPETLELFLDSAGQLQPANASWTENGNEASTTVEVTSGARLLLRVSSTSESSYRITATRAAPATCEDDDYEPNDTQAEAFLSLQDQLPDDVGLGAFHLSLCGSDVDWINLESPDTMAPQEGNLIELAALTFDPAQTIDLTLWDANGMVATATTTTVTGGSTWNWHSLTYVVPPGGAGEYFARAESNSGDIEEYRIYGIVRPDDTCAPDADEPNDQRSDAVVIPNVVGELQQQSQTLCGDDEDWYSIDLAAGQTFNFDTYYASTEDLDVELYRAGEQMPVAMGQGFPGGTRNIAYTVPAGEGGTYHLRLTRPDYSPNVFYMRSSIISN